MAPLNGWQLRRNFKDSGGCLALAFQVASLGSGVVPPPVQRPTPAHFSTSLGCRGEGLERSGAALWPPPRIASLLV